MEKDVDYVFETLKMCEVGSWEEAAAAGKNPTTTRWVDRTKTDEEGEEVVRCRLVGLRFQSSA